MTNENQKQQDEKLLNLFPNVLLELNCIGASSISDTHKFFKTAFLELTEYELFDDPTYRQQWQYNIDVIHSLSLPFIGYTDQEIQDAIKITELVLSENRKKVLDV